MHYFSLFFEKRKKPWVNITRVWTKNKLLGIFDKFSEIFKRCISKILKNPLFSIFFEKCNKPCVTFSRVWENCRETEKILVIFDENSIQKFNFYLFLERLLLKIETSEINSIFYNNFSGSGGGFKPPDPPAYATHFLRAWTSRGRGQFLNFGTYYCQNLVKYNNSLKERWFRKPALG